LFLLFIYSLFNPTCGLTPDKEDTSTVYDREYFESKFSEFCRGVDRVCVFSITLTGPLGLVRGGVRNYFDEAVRDIIPSDKYEVKWNKNGTRIRVIIVNFEESEKQSVFEKLNKLSDNGTRHFTFEEKSDESLTNVVMKSKFTTGNSTTTCTTTTPEKMRLLAWGGGNLS
jgi:hypothetical protein